MRKRGLGIEVLSETEVGLGLVCLFVCLFFKLWIIPDRIFVP